MRVPVFPCPSNTCYRLFYYSYSSKCEYLIVICDFILFVCMYICVLQYWEWNIRPLHWAVSLPLLVFLFCFVVIVVWNRDSPCCPEWAWSCAPPASASQSPGITGMQHHTWLCIFLMSNACHILSLVGISHSFFSFGEMSVQVFCPFLICFMIFYY